MQMCNLLGIATPISQIMANFEQLIWSPTFLSIVWKLAIREWPRAVRKGAFTPKDEVKTKGLFGSMVRCGTVTL